MVIPPMNVRILMELDDHTPQKAMVLTCWDRGFFQTWLADLPPSVGDFPARYIPDILDHIGILLLWYYYNIILYLTYKFQHIPEKTRGFPMISDGFPMKCHITIYFPTVEWGWVVTE